jgi:hypothetical protein
METRLYAIYFKGTHRGNIRSTSESNAIKEYLIDSLLGDFINDIDFLFYFSAIEAVENIHYTKSVFFD